MAQQFKIILGSASPARKKILQEMGYEFEVMPSGIDEKAIRSDDPKELVVMLAYAKAEALLLKIQDPVILITSDQVVVCNGAIREKPETEAKARQYLRSLAPCPVETVTAVVVTNTDVKKHCEGADMAKVIFSEIPAETIERYIQSGEAFTHAGGFDIANPQFMPYVKEIQGEYESILGLDRKSVV